MGSDELRRQDVQGLLVSGYARMHRAKYVMLEVTDRERARRWLDGLLPRITTSVRPTERRCVNIAFTASGLRELGISDADLLTFSVPFQEGMAEPHRSRVLGDWGPSDPSTWVWGRLGDDRLHVLLLLFGCDPDELAEVESDELAPAVRGGAVAVVHELTPEPLPGKVNCGKFGIEHFGFADGMSQPVVRGSGQEQRYKGDDARRTVIEPGEFVLGYRNAYGKVTPVPRVATGTGRPWDFGRHGTYLVFRQLAQDVAGFWQYVDRQTLRPDGSADEEARVRLASKMVGRWPSGAPLVRTPHLDDPDLGADNSFGFAQWDREGLRCPIGSHVRRSNPRDASPDARPPRALELANLHRIIRRGRVYGAGLDAPLDGDDGQERGLFFLCLNANIERQFEFVQQNWCNNTKFGGLYDEADPITGTQPEGGGQFTVQGVPVRTRHHGVPNFVTVRGGAYFFLPGIPALRYLATGRR